MKFYTNVSRLGNAICYRGYENGERVTFRKGFSPVMYVPSKDGTANYRTLDGRSVKEIQFESLSEATEFWKNYDNIDSVEVHGNNNFAAQFIQSMYPNEIKYDPAVIKVANIDIEVASDDGFPEPEQAACEVQSICLKYHGGSM